jgi:hypothetical protein
MPKNLFVQTSILLPHLICGDVTEAMAWLTKAFGFDDLAKKS